jgi:hypothetical protein
MALRFLKLRCDECGDIFRVRRPLSENLVAAVAQAAKCPHCHPEALESVCPACLIPFCVAPCHAQGLCYACYISYLRYRRSQAVTKAIPAISFEHGLLPGRGGA